MEKIKFKLPEWYITGLVDGEGSFGVSVFPDKTRSLGYSITVAFEIGLHSSDLILLEGVKDYFKVGSIYPHTGNMFRYKVSSLDSLILKVIPHFERYPLSTHKRADFYLFRDIVFLLAKKELTPTCLKEVVSLKAALNRGVSRELFLANPGIIPAKRAEFLPEIPHPQWVQGFTEGEGCFFVTLANNSRLKLGIQVTVGFVLTQHIRDLSLLKAFISFFGCGSFSIRKDKMAGDFKVSGVKELSEKIIPFFQKYPILGSKKRKFDRLLFVLGLIREKKHLQEWGLNAIKNSKVKI